MLIIPGKMFSQQISNFKEKTFIRIKNGNFRTNRKDSVCLRYINKDSTIINNTLTYRGKIGSDDIVLYNIDTAINYNKGIKLDTSGIKFFKFKKNVLFGEIRQDKTTLYFYPWPFKNKAKIDSFFNSYKFYLNIPERTVVRVGYRSWQFGTLTLPLKVYLGSKSDTLKNNVGFDANLSFMIGRKWGKEKYYYLPNDTEGQSYTKSVSLNVVCGVSKLDIDDTNTTPKDTSYKYSIAALSYGVAFEFQYKKIGIFVATGLDTPLSKFGRDWNFRNTPWLGFGFGLGL
jgi:hypothetical protein